MVKRPTKKDEETLLSLDSDKKDEITIPGTNAKVKIGWIKPYTVERISLLHLSSGIGDESGLQDKERIKKLSKYASKLTALYLLNGLKIIFFYPFYWRWLYYVKGYDYNQLEGIIQEGKKKIPYMSLLAITAYARESKITNMMMTEEELNRSRQELLSEAGMLSEKNILGQQLR